MAFIKFSATNIKCIYITTGISVLFGAYSIYNIVEYLGIIHSLTHSVNYTKKKHSDLQTKHAKLQKNYNELLLKYENISKEVQTLHVRLIELQETNVSDICTSEVNTTLTMCSPCAMCAKLQQLNSEMQRQHIEDANIEDANIEDANIEDADLEFVETLNIGHGSNTEGSSTCVSNKSVRGVSVTEINWSEITKKFFFG